MSGEALWALMALGIPFLLGVAVGIEIRRQRPVVEQVLVEREVPDLISTALREDIAGIRQRLALIGEGPVYVTRCRWYREEGQPDVYLITSSVDLTA